MSQETMISDDVLRKIKDGAAAVRDAGEALTNRIKSFEAWLAKLPGRVATQCELWSSDDGRSTGNLSFEKEGKEWVLYTFECDETDGTIYNRRLLRDASIGEKSFAIDRFPILLKSIADTQVSIVNSAVVSAEKFDAFAQSIGLKEGA